MMSYNPSFNSSTSTSLHYTRITFIHSLPQLTNLTLSNTTFATASGDTHMVLLVTAVGALPHSFKLISFFIDGHNDATTLRVLTHIPSLTDFYHPVEADPHLLAHLPLLKRLQLSTQFSKTLSVQEIMASLPSWSHTLEKFSLEHELLRIDQLDEIFSYPPRLVTLSYHND